MFRLTLCGVPMEIEPRYPDTVRFFRSYAPSGSLEELPQLAERNAEGIAPSERAKPIRIPDPDWDEALSEGMRDNAHTEYSLLTEYCSDRLLAHNCVIMHAAALRWREKAWLICAESGKGKTTQAYNLQKLRPGDFSVICGDRPILSFQDNAIIVHPSPWNGKENWHGAEAAPLAGVIVLNRGDQNRLTLLFEREAVLPIYMHFIHTAWETENIRKIAELETRLLSSVPVWQLTSSQVPDSTKLLLEAIFS